MNYDSLHAQLSPLTFNPSEDNQIEYCRDILDYFEFFNINFEETLSNVSHYFGKFETEGFEIAAHYFLKPNAAGTYFILHGYYDHVGIYQHVIRFCLEQNYSVVAFDLPGHGLSSGERASIDSFDQYKSVLQYVLNACGEEFPKPWHCIAQSTGAAILMNYLLSEKLDRENSPFEKIVMLAPLVQPFNWRLGRWVYELTKYFRKSVSRQFSVNSSSEEFLTFLKNDDFLQPKRLPVAWVGAMKEWIDRFEKLPDTDLSPIIIQGKRDATVNWRFNVPAIMSKFRSARVHFLSNACHQLVNESNVIRSRIFQIIEEG